MAYSLENTSDLTALGNAIRTKTGSNANMTVANMATAVNNISTGFTNMTSTSQTSTNKGKSTSLTLTSPPSVLQGGNTDFYVIVYAHHGVSFPSTMYVFKWVSGQYGSFTTICGAGSNKQLQIEWYDSTKKNLKISTTDGSSVYWAIKQSSTNNHIFFIYPT